MTIYRNTVRRLVAGVISCALLPGCQTEPPSMPEVSSTAPAQFEQDGNVWKKQDAMQSQDKDCLAAFFAANGDLVGSPEFEGTPTVFLAGKSDRRFYWLQPSADGDRWRCVEFKKRKFSTLDGIGNPFE